MKARRDKGLEAGLTKQDVYNYAWRLKNVEKYLLHSAKNRATKMGWDFNLTVEDITIPEVCPVFGIPLFIRQGYKGKGMNHNAPSLDRIDSSKGYIKGNVQIISWRANSLKGDGKLDEFEKLVEYWRAKKEPI